MYSTIEELQEEVVKLKQDIVWIIYLLEKIDKSVEAIQEKLNNEPTK